MSSYTVSRNPDYIQSQYNASPDDIVVNNDRSVAIIISNAGTQTAFYKSRGPVVYYSILPDLAYFITAELGSDTDELLYLNDMRLVNFMYSAYPKTYQWMLDKGYITPAQKLQTTGMNFVNNLAGYVSKNQPTIPVFQNSNPPVTLSPNAPSVLKGDTPLSPVVTNKDVTISNVDYQQSPEQNVLLPSQTITTAQQPTNDKTAVPITANTNNTFKISPLIILSIIAFIVLVVFVIK